MRLIDADRLIERLSNASAFYGHETAGDFDRGRALGLSDAAVKAAEEPVIEAEPVKHGRLVSKGAGYIECSVCGQIYTNIAVLYKCCPYCTARFY